jgi:hypothetical protein
MEMCGGVEVQSIFFTTALNGDEWSTTLSEPQICVWRKEKFPVSRN